MCSLLSLSAVWRPYCGNCRELPRAWRDGGLCCEARLYGTLLAVIWMVEELKLGAGVEATGLWESCREIHVRGSIDY